MYYRRKILLAILQKADYCIGKINLQKVLFLVTRKQNTPCFDFLPYKFGCYSFQANKDLVVLSNHYLLVENNEKVKKWKIKETKENYFSQLKKEDKEIINDVFKNFEVQDTEKLTDKVYDLHPYFTIYSTRNLTKKQQEKQTQEKRKIQNDKKQLFSIGYEGISIDGYLNALVKNNVKLLCDVRKNPLSMKYGFSKNQLSKYCKSINIEYKHISNLGIESQKRKDLNSFSDYQYLFKNYEKDLENKSEYFQELKEFFRKYNRIALTCFEKKYQCCHRNTLINYYKQNIENIEPIHL